MSEIYFIFSDGDWFYGDWSGVLETDDDTAVKVVGPFDSYADCITDFLRGEV